MIARTLLRSVALVACVTTAACTRAPEIGAWITYWRADAGIESALQIPPPFKDVFLFGATLDSAGNPITASLPRNSVEIVRQLRKQQVKVWITVVNDVHSPTNKPKLKDPDLIHSVLSSSVRRSQHISRLIEITRSVGADALDVDYENLNYSDKDNFTAFVTELAKTARTFGIELSLTVQPKATEKSTGGAGAVDWPKVCNVVDRFQIMLYNLHSERTAPGPLSTVAWAKSVMNFAVHQGCEPGKLVPILKISGTNWGAGKVSSITFAEAHTLLEKFQSKLERHNDTEGATPYFSYLDNNEDHTVYFEDARSIGIKLKALEDAGFFRTMLWSLGDHDPGIDNISRRAK